MRTARRLSTTAALLLASACAMNTPDPGLSARCETEIVELHRFFQDWFNGALPETDAAFARFADVLHPDFHIIVPNGRVIDRTGILELVRSGHGRSSQAESPFVIEVRNVRWRSSVDGGYVLTYEEWQGEGTASSGRTSTVLFRPSPAAPNGVQWMHVHETEQ